MAREGHPSGSADALRVDLRQAIACLSDALDTVGIDPSHHGRRVGLMAMRVAQASGLGEATVERLGRAGLLHDCGVTSPTLRFQVRPPRNGLRLTTDDHADRGARLVASVSPLEALAPLIRLHHTPWRPLAESTDPEEALLANILFLCDQVDALDADHPVRNDVRRRERILRELTRHADSAFAPALVECLHDIAGTTFWDELSAGVIEGTWDAWLARGPEEIGGPTVRSLAHLFANVVDAKSHFTADHSEGVTRLSLRVGRAAGLSDERLASLEIAALLHDVGKLHVPESILEKAGRLDAGEQAIVRLHAHHSHAMLSRIDGLAEVATWAGLHHARLDDSGYAYPGAPATLPLEARIIAVADVFQACAQDRPYRESMPPEVIARFLWDEAEAGRLDAAVVELATRDAAESWSECRAAFAPPYAPFEDRPSADRPATALP